MNDHMIVHLLDRTSAVFYILMVQNPAIRCSINMSYFFSNDIYITDLAVPSVGDSSWNVFFYNVRLYDGSVWNGLYTFRVEIFASSCTYSSSQIRSPISVYYVNGLIGVAKSGLKSLVVFVNEIYVFEYDSASITHQFSVPQTLLDYRPDMIDTLYIDDWALMTGEKLVDGLYTPTLYLIDYSPNRSLSSIVDLWTPSLPYSWQRSVLRTFLDAFVYTIQNASSVSVNKRGDILFGVQSLNTVYYLRVNPSNPSSLIFRSSRMNDADNPRVGFGKSVAWLDDDTAVILANSYSLDYTDFYYSRIEIYDLSGIKRLTDSTEPYVFFPNSRQQLPSMINSYFIQVTASYYGAIAIMDSNGYIYVISPPGEGYYAVTNIVYCYHYRIYYSIRALCPQGTTRPLSHSPKEILDACSPCGEGFFYQQIISGTSRCEPCSPYMFCSISSVSPISKSYLENRSQATSYPKSTEASAFDDVLLSNMFSMNFQSNCFFVAPMFWTLCMLGLAVVFIMTVGILRCTGKCPSLLGALQSIFTHFDIINDGERWIGGVFSFAILIMIAYAALFTNSFLTQYPLSESKAPHFTCDDSLRNSDFFTSMKPLNNYMIQRSGSIFNLMSRQEFTIVITFLSIASSKTISVTQTAGSVKNSLSCTRQIPDPQVNILSCPLTSLLGSVVFNVSDVQYLGGIRLAMKAPKLVEGNLQGQEVDFIYSYRIPYHVVASEPYFKVELTPLINETKPLSSGELSKLSGIWLPIIDRDDTRNFVTKKEHDDNQQSSVLLTIELEKAKYYIANQEKPLIRANRAIFKNILFASTCMELFGFGFLLMKLAILPLSRFILKKLRKNKEGENDNEEEEEGEEEEDDDDDDETGAGPGGNTIGPTQLAPAVNEWYIPETETKT